MSEQLPDQLDQRIMREAIGGAWPKEARPGRITAFKQDGLYWEMGTSQPGPDCHAFRVWIDAEHATSLFQISGLRWLEHQQAGCEHLSFIEHSHGWHVWACNGDMHNGPTLLSALDSAVRSIHSPGKVG